jgi:hypothetical protein
MVCEHLMSCKHHLSLMIFIRSNGICRQHHWAKWDPAIQVLICTTQSSCLTRSKMDLGNGQTWLFGNTCVYHDCCVFTVLVREATLLTSQSLSHCLCHVITPLSLFSRNVELRLDLFSSLWTGQTEISPTALYSHGRKQNSIVHSQLADSCK